MTQSLYEKKLVTYPRTDSQYLTEDMRDTAVYLLGAIRRTFLPDSTNDDVEIGRIINNSKVSDHHAIIPTAEIEKQDLSGFRETRSVRFVQRGNRHSEADLVQYAVRCRNKA